MQGLADIGPLLVTAIPLGVYNFTEGMNNVESASAAGDNYNLRNILLADGIGAIVGSLLGSPFPPAVYIGHPGWKAVGGRIGYSLATGVVIALVCFLGLTALLLAVVPLVAILPILLYIGLVIGAQAFTASPAKHAPAVVLAIIPNIAAWAQTPGRRRARRSRGPAPARSASSAGEQRRDLRRHGAARRRSGAGRTDTRGDRGVHHRPRIQQGGDLCAGWGGAGVLRLHPWRSAQWMASPQVALGYALFAVICYVVGVRESRRGRNRRRPNCAQPIAAPSGEGTSRALRRMGQRRSR